MQKLNLYGPQYGLPHAISGINSNWERGYGNPPPQTLIVVLETREAADRNFQSCRLAGHLWDRYGIKTDEMEWGPDIFVCGPNQCMLVPLIGLYSPFPETQSPSES